MIDWSKSHCGLYHCPFDSAHELMPEVSEILNALPETLAYKDYAVVDVKVHMLMPYQWPCIPNWHRDLIPRGADSAQQMGLATNEKRLWMWVSGHPLTEFDMSNYPNHPYGFVPPQTWINFSQMDVHRGTQSQEHCWRCFIRVAPRDVLPPAPMESRLRRHCQVYVREDFVW